jgi:hypothetical protein
MRAACLKCEDHRVEHLDTNFALLRSARVDPEVFRVLVRFGSFLPERALVASFAFQEVGELPHVGPCDHNGIRSLIGRALGFLRAQQFLLQSRYVHFKDLAVAHL